MKGKNPVVAIAGLVFCVVLLWVMVTTCTDHHESSTPTTSEPSATDTKFLSDLKSAGVTYTTPQYAIDRAHEVCSKLSSGWSRSAIHDYLAQKHEFNEPEMFVSVAVVTYCPEYKRTGTPEPTTSQPYAPSSSPVATAITPPPGAQHSSIANVFVPPNASLEPAEDTAPGGERWDLNAGYADTIAQQEALLPVG
jgi:hypothetical protein